jgi:alpha-D-ribose 1-methylphosphonate 5-triphosphate synthase subunit PhnH
MQTTALEGGFLEAPAQSAVAFRAIMTALARPGDIHTVTGALPPAPLSVAAGVSLLTLCDPETPVFLAPSHDTSDLRNWITFHTGAPLVDAGQALFAVGPWQALPLADFAIGTSEYPDRSATLIVELPALSAAGAVLSGPGIKDQAVLSLPETAAFQRNRALFPLGLDFYFTHGDRLAGLPRSTQVS